eukprot:scaffold8252_cov74-Skeletonema_menzelii.AAC.1
MVNYCCAAKHLCAMKTIQISPVVHHCMNCRLPMHGALCGALYSEMPTDIFINFDALSFEGRKRVNVQGAVMCGVCIESCRKEVTVQPLPEPVSAEQLQINMEAITIDEVITFVEDTRN